jgi:hypothetical protein
MCDNCSHSLVCEKTKQLFKFHEAAKKDLLIDITMNDCADFRDDAFMAGKDEDAK